MLTYTLLRFILELLTEALHMAAFYLRRCLRQARYNRHTGYT